MKKKRGTLAILLILAILVLSIGYAVLTKTLTVNGTLGAKANDANFKVEFTAASKGTPTVAVKDIEPVIEAIAPVEGNTALASFKVTNFTSAGDTVTLSYTVKNSSVNLSATVEAKLNENGYENSEYFKVTPTFKSSKTATSNTIAAGATDTLEVVVTCIKTPTEDVAEATTQGMIVLTATASES